MAAVPANVPEHPMTREQYYAWAEQQPRGRFEREDGHVVAMSAERVGHAMVKARVFQALDDAIRKAGVPCFALPDGVTVQIGEGTDYEPDATVASADSLDLDAFAAPSPVIVVEVASRATRSVDRGAKLAAYFRVSSIQHYLMVSARKREVIHHRRAGDHIETRIIVAGPLALDPPGVLVGIEDLYARLPL